MIGTIVPLVQEEPQHWRRIAWAYVSGSLLGGLVFFGVVGLLGNLLFSDMPPALLMIASGLVLLLVVGNDLWRGRALLLGMTKGVPQSWWVTRRKEKAAFAYGATLSLGIFTPIPYSSFIGLTALALLAGDWRISVLAGMVFGLCLALPVPTIGQVFRATDQSLVRHRLSVLADRLAGIQDEVGMFNLIVQVLLATALITRAAGSLL